MFRGKPWLALSAGIGALYVILIVWAKFARTIGAPPIKLGEVGEFLLFLAAILAFSAQVVVEDQLRRATGDQEEQP